jgi:hypothetical protein
MMKKVFWLASLLTALVVSASIPALAASGKAIVPPFDARFINSNVYYGESFFVTNITSNPITVKITIYNQTGAMVTTGLTAGTTSVTNLVVNPGDSSVSFTLAANATGSITYSPTTLDAGYATIAWSQDGSSVQYGLIADVKEYLTWGSTSTQRTISVNNNLPF